MGRRRSFFQRYRQLGLWSKIGFWGAVASVGSLLFAVVYPFGEVKQEQVANLVDSPGVTAINSGRDTIINQFLTQDTGKIHSVIASESVELEKMAGTPVLRAGDRQLEPDANKPRESQRVAKTENRIEEIVAKKTPNDSHAPPETDTGIADKILANHEWIFSGIGVYILTVVLAALVFFARFLWKRKGRKSSARVDEGFSSESPPGKVKASGQPGGSHSETPAPGAQGGQPFDRMLPGEDGTSADQLRTLIGTSTVSLKFFPRNCRLQEYADLSSVQGACNADPEHAGSGSQSRGEPSLKPGRRAPRSPSGSSLARG